MKNLQEAGSGNGETRDGSSMRRLARSISLLEAIPLLLGLVVGAGVFVMVGKNATQVGPGLFLAYALAAVPMVFGILRSKPDALLCTCLTVAVIV